MLPHRPAGAPPPRPAGKPPGSPPVSSLGKPPGPPPGPPPGSPGKAAPAKPPPRGPPPATASSNEIPSQPPPASPAKLPPRGAPPVTASPNTIPHQPPPGAPPARAEAKTSTPAPATPTKKAPPPPRVTSPVLQPPEDAKIKDDTSGRSSPRPPPGQPPGSPNRANPPGSASAPPTRPPQGAPPGDQTSPPPRGPPGKPPGVPPQGAPRDPPRGPPPGPPPGAPRGAPPGAPRGPPPGPPPGAPRGAPPGAPRGPPPGPPPGAPRGAPPGAPRGPPPGPPPGLPRGAPSGAPRDPPPGSPPGAPRGAPRGASSDAPRGAPRGPPPGPPPGAPRDALPGAPRGVPPGAPLGVRPDAPRGAPSGASQGAPPDAPPGAPSGAPPDVPQGARPDAPPRAAPINAPQDGRPSTPPRGAPPVAPSDAPPGAPPGAPPAQVSTSAAAGVKAATSHQRPDPNGPLSSSTAADSSGAPPTMQASEGNAQPRGLEPSGVGADGGGGVGADTGPVSGNTGGGGRGEVSAPSIKRQKTPPPSPKAPPGVPAGIIPPKSPPPGKSVAAKTLGSANASRKEADAEGDGGEQASSVRSPPVLTEKAKTSPPGDPGKRRPPPGAPPGRAPPSLAQPKSRPSPPPVEEVAIAALAEEEAIVIADEQGEGEGIPPPPEDIPPPDGLSDDDDDESNEGRIVLVADEEDETSAVDEARAPKELEVVRPGRFTVRCIGGGDIRKNTSSSTTPAIDVYLRITLGKHKRALMKRSKVVKRSGVSPDFKSELVTFDVVEPEEFIVGGDVMLSIEVWEDSAWTDELLSSVQLSALRFMRPDAVPSAEWIPLEAPSGRIKDRMRVQVEISFVPVHLGMFVLTLYEGRGLGAADPAVVPNPYVVATLGEMYQKRSRVVAGGGSKPFFREEDIVMWIDKENWTNDLHLQVRSEELGTDAELGSATISVIQAMGVPLDQPKESKLELVLDGKPSGQLYVKKLFLPAGKLTVMCGAGRGLREVSAARRMDPYVVLKADGKAVSLSRKTNVDKDGGTDPQWDETMEMDIVDQYTIWLECFNHDMMESDQLIGSAQFSLLPVFKRGTVDAWVQLTASSGPGPPKAAGEIHCVFTFEGPVGVAYPQYQPGIDSFDDSLRVNLKGYLDEPSGEEKRKEMAEGGGGDTGAEVVAYQGGEALLRSTEFSDDEIAAAFKFLDLDHNLHIGAAEIRHILICMGELITDEEVDMMISMVDLDGDGQVSYDEFRRLVIDPDPARADFGTAPLKSEVKEAEGVTQEMKDREIKRWLLEDFVKENDIKAVELEIAYKRFRTLVPSAGGGQSTQAAGIDFSTWISVFNVEATGQYRKLFKLYAIKGAGGGTGLEENQEKVDIRELFLGMANFVEWTLETRTQFIFTLFDEDRSGFLSMAELVAVLKANHLSSAKAVANKAQTIMRQADADGSGTLTSDEFLVVAKKFPNLLFPAKRKTEATQPNVPLLGN